MWPIADWLLGVITIDKRLVSWAGCFRFWVRVLSLCMVWPLPICIFSLSSSLNMWVKFSIQLNSKVLQIKGVCAGSWFVFLVKTTIDETTYLFKIFFLQFINITNHLLMAKISLFWFWERHPLKPYNGCEFPKIYRTFDTCGLRTLGHSLLFL